VKETAMAAETETKNAGYESVRVRFVGLTETLQGPASWPFTES
jgi:hypothetical protein